MLKVVAGDAEASLQHINSKKDFEFFLVCAATQTIKHNGISAAGANQEMLKYTAALDAEYLEYGFTKTFSDLPVSPKNIVSPALISKACLNLSAAKHHIIDAGTLAKAKINSLIDLNASAAASIESASALDLDEVRRLFQAGKNIIKEKQNPEKYFVIGECVVAGTTTAYALLKFLGHDCDQMLSSSIPEGNHSLKQKLVKQAFENALKVHKSTEALEKAIQDEPLLAIAMVGDPMQAVVAGMIMEAYRIKQTVLLAGGSQMLAIASLVEKIFQKENLPLSEIENFAAIATTKWVIHDKSAQITELAKLVCPSFALIYEDFQASEDFECLKIFEAYDAGHVKEGVGAGALLVASLLQPEISLNQLFLELDKQLSALKAKKS